MKIDNVNVYGIQQSVVASGLPMTEEYGYFDFEKKVDVISQGMYYRNELTCEDACFYTQSMERIKKLASCKGGESHDCFLCGIIVQMNVTAPRYWWPELQRYHFADIVSATSTMHRLKNFIAKAIEYKSLNYEEKWIELYQKHFSKSTCIVAVNAYIEYARCLLDAVCTENEITTEMLSKRVALIDIEDLKANLPDGFLQTARISTNYRQLKTIYHQRKNHRLSEWREFCEWIKTLPMTNKLIIEE